MSFGDDIGREFEAINKKRDRIIKSAALNLHGDLVSASPVALVKGGELKQSWQLPRQISRTKWIITNIAPHAIIIDGGRRFVPTANGQKEIGSEQLSKGFSPIIEITEKALTRALR